MPIVGFDCHQAVEKALKAVLALHAVDYPFTHDLVRLADLLAECGEASPIASESLDALIPFDVRLRYPTIEAVVYVVPEDALARAQVTIEWANGRVASH